MKILSFFRAISACGIITVLVAAPSSLLAIPFDGHSLTARVVYGGFDPYPGSLVTFVVDSTPGAVEVPVYGGGGDLRIDVFDVDATHASILFTSLHTQSYSYGASPNLLVINDTFGTIADILSVSLGAVSWPGATSVDLSFTTDSVSFDFGDLRIVEGDYFRLDITTAPPPVPDSSSSAVLLGVAMSGLVCFRSRVLKRV